MVSFGDSKHEPVKPLQSLLGVTRSNIALSAKCTIHDVANWRLFVQIYFFLLYFSNVTYSLWLIVNNFKSLPNGNQDENRN